MQRCLQSLKRTVDGIAVIALLMTFDISVRTLGCS